MIRLVASFMVMMIGMSIGYHIRKEETRDRYLVSLAERHESEASYFNKKTDQMIRQYPPMKGVKQ